MHHSLCSLHRCRSRCTPYLLNPGGSAKHLGGQNSTHKPHPYILRHSIVTSPRACDGMLSSTLESFELIFLKPVLLLAVVEQLVPELGMGNLNKCLGALPDGLSVQIGNAEFRDDVMYVGASRKHTRAMRQPGHD